MSSYPLTLTRSDATYGRPLQCRIEITSLDSTDTYFTFSPLQGLTTDLNLMYLDTERSANETGSFNAIIEDSNNVINKDHLRNAKIKISLGKTTGTLIPYFIGYADIFQTRRPRNNYQEYLLTGPSTKIQATELMLLIRKAADDPNNPKYGIANLIVDMITARKWRPLNREDIQEVTEAQGGRWLADLVSEGGGISDELNALKYSVIVEVFTTAWDFLERMSAITGASWDLDYDAAFQEIVTFGYPSTRGTGINIKSTDLASPTDNPVGCYLQSP